MSNDSIEQARRRLAEMERVIAAANEAQRRLAPTMLAMADAVAAIDRASSSLFGKIQVPMLSDRIVSHFEEMNALVNAEGLGARLQEALSASDAIGRRLADVIGEVPPVTDNLLRAFGSMPALAGHKALSDQLSNIRTLIEVPPISEDVLRQLQKIVDAAATERERRWTLRVAFRGIFLAATGYELPKVRVDPATQLAFVLSLLLWVVSYLHAQHVQALKDAQTAAEFKQLRREQAATTAMLAAAIKGIELQLAAQPAVHSVYLRARTAGILRQAPHGASERAGRVSRGTKLRLIQSFGGWHLVQPVTEDGQDAGSAGWIYNRVVRVEPLRKSSGPLQRIATEGRTRGKEAPQVPAPKKKNARHSTRGNSGR